MIDAPPRKKGDQTRECCLAGVKGLFAAISRQIRLLRESRATRQIVLEINSVNGVLSAVESSTKFVEAVDAGSDPDDVLGEIFDQLEQLALPDCHKTIRIKIVSVNGALSAINTESTRHRWDI